jgi:hypothetical protein
VYIVDIRCLANLCVTHSGTMYLTFSCEVCDSIIVQHILEILRMMGVVCYLVYSSCIVHDFNSITLLFSSAPILDV